MVLLFFKVFSSMIYTILHAIKPLVVFGRFNSSCFSWFAVIKRNHWMPSQWRMTHQFDVLADQKGAGLSRSVRASIVSCSHRSCSFLEFLRGLWANKLCCTTQNWLSYAAQVEQSPHEQFCRRNRRPSASKWFCHKQLSLDLARVRRPTRLSVVLYRAYTHSSKIRNQWRSYKRLLKPGQELIEQPLLYC